MTMRVLIVDDDQDHAESVGDILQMRGYAVELAASGEQAIARFQETDFHIVLMDVKLPGMNGVETFAEFRRIRPAARVLMMTGFSVEALLAEAIGNGALGVLRKPFAIAELLETIERVKPRGMVLVADDDPDFAESIEPILQRNGYVVEIARNGREALEKASTPGLTCLILDLRMPLLTGIEVFLKIKESTTPIPTIFVTGNADADSDALREVNGFGRGLLMKPFDPADLLRALEQAAQPRGPEYADAG
ncbi:MAG TPA: response regulator [Stellaceae bacterium]|nr:response regulator [Stellaceae bacterium]